MISLARALSFAVFPLALAAASPAFAAIICHRVETQICHTVKTHHTTHRTYISPHRAVQPRAAARNNSVCDAQKELADLGYYGSSVDCVIGPQTRAALKQFQRDNGLKADGVLGPKTLRALRNAAHRSSDNSQNYLSPHGTGTGAALNNVNGSDVVDDDYATSLNGGAKVLNSRFARIDVNETGSGPDKRYAVNLNGSPVLTADGQPSVIDVSQVFDMGDEEAVIFTTYSPDQANCMYRHHVLAMTASATQMLDLDNCTRRANAEVVKGSLMITLPEHDDACPIGAVWRLQGMDLERL